MICIYIYIEEQTLNTQHSGSWYIRASLPWVECRGRLIKLLKEVWQQSTLALLTRTIVFASHPEPSPCLTKTKCMLLRNPKQAQTLNLKPSLRQLKAANSTVPVYVKWQGGWVGSERAQQCLLRLEWSQTSGISKAFRVLIRASVRNSIRVIMAVVL